MSENQKNLNEALREQLKNYGKSTPNSSTSKLSKEELQKKYFKLQSEKEIFRILPLKNKVWPFETAFFHEVPMLMDGGKKQYGVKIYCPAHNSPKIPKLDANGKPVVDEQGKVVLVPQPCPLCAKAEALLAKQDTSIKFIKKENLTEAQQKIKAENDKIYSDANQWLAKEFVIVKGIDRGVEKDGPKFWRFKVDNYKKQGALDKLVPIVGAYMDSTGNNFYDIDNGADLQLMTVDSELKRNGKTTLYKTISAVIALGPRPLHSDPVMSAQWANDSLTWRDVFKPKSAPNCTEFEVLEMIANGSNPYFDTTDEKNKHWVFPGRPDLEEKANTRNKDLDADGEKEIKMASDIDEYTQVVIQPRPTITNMTPDKVGEYVDDAEQFDDGGDVEDYVEPTITTENTSVSDINVDDLPF